MVVTAAILFLPKLLAIFLIVRCGQQGGFGGTARLVASACLEVLLSSLLAPIRMVFHTRFVLANLLGRTVQWGVQARGEGGTSWREAVRRHGFDTVWATAWGVGLYVLNPDYFWWVTPIVGALVLSIPLSVLTSRVDLGREARAAGLLLVPEEVAPPPVLRDLATLAATAADAASDGFVRVIADPALNAIHRAQLGRRRSVSVGVRAARDRLIARALAHGPATLDAGERRSVLVDPGAVDELHRRVWCELAPARAARWLGS
jgi:membrane glycosyltransferase